jgi:general secretion pathway protein A
MLALRLDYQRAQRAAMYTQFFSLQQAPFSIAPDPRYLFMSERHREALAHLLYGVGSGGGFVLLTGEIGAGKTTVCRCFLEQIPANCNVAYIFNPKLTVPELLQSICDEFQIGLPGLRHGGAASVKDYVDALNAYLLAAHADGQHNVLIIDEAQSLSADVLEQLRLLTNLETSQSKLLQIILIGQPELRTMLARPELEQLAQRVIARYHLASLSEPETAAYIVHRLAVAGLIARSAFKSAAMRQIYRLTQGVPRRINLLCDRALLGAYAENKHVVDRTIVKKAAREVFGHATAPAAAAARWPIAVGLMAGAAMLGTLAWSMGWHLKSVKPQPAVVSAAAPVPARASVPVPASLPPAAVSAAIPATLPLSPAPPAALAPWEPGAVVDAGLRERRDAYRQLAALWGFSLPDGVPCQLARKEQLHCYVGNRIALSEIQRLDRPAILTLHADTGTIYYALLTGLSSDSATVRLGDASKTVSLPVLARQFRGELVTFWHTPTARDISGLEFGPGSQGAEVDWVAVQLARLNGTQTPPVHQVFGPALASQVQQFQRSHGLDPDGVVGPKTFMYLNRAAGINEPQLQHSVIADHKELGK